MSGSGWRPHIESGRCLCVNALLRHGSIRPGFTTSGSWCWTQNGETVAAVGYNARLGLDSGELRLSYTWRPDGELSDVVCTIRLSSLPLQFGGRRWYMHCPYTDRRVLKLYKFGSIEKFCARTAIRPLPTYASQRVSGSDRINAQRWAIRRKIGDDLSDLFGEPYKPKRMHWRTFQRYADRDAELAEREGGYLQRLLARWQRYG
jgi:hypothetical protein